MKKQAAIPMKVVLEALKAQAERPKVVAQRVVGEKARDAARRVVQALVKPEGFLSKGLPPEIGAGAQPAKAKIGLLAKLFEDMEKGGQVRNRNPRIQAMLERKRREATKRQQHAKMRAGGSKNPAMEQSLVQHGKGFKPKFSPETAGQQNRNLARTGANWYTQKRTGNFEQDANLATRMATMQQALMDAPDREAQAKMWQLKGKQMDAVKGYDVQRKKGLKPEQAIKTVPAKQQPLIKTMIDKGQLRASTGQPVMGKISAADAYCYGFMVKFAQAGVKPDLSRQFLDAVPPDPKAGRKAFENILTAGKIGVSDINLKDVSKLDPKRMAAMQAAVKGDLAGAASVEDFLAAKNPYGKWKTPVKYRAFSKVQKGYNPMLADFVKKNPDIIRKFIASRSAKPEIKK